MKRFIRYLYEYEHEKRIRNVGFVKVETGNDETIVHMQVKGFDNREQKLGLYLFYEENGRLIKIWGGEKKLDSPVLSWHYTFSEDDVGGLEKYRAICGMLLETEMGRRMAVTWDDKCVDVSRMEEFATEQEEICDQEEVRQRTKKCTKITRQDLSRLPRCEWKLANNRFLMHGYNNFHHLLFIEEGNYLKLGVPGIYHINEAKCADTFGFGEFISCEELEKNAEIQENYWEDQDDNEIWGYWCKPVKRRQ